MNLVHTIQHYWPFIAGGERYCQIISEGLALEHDIKVFTSDVISTYPLVYADSLTETKNGVRIERIHGLPIFAGIYGRKSLDGGSNSFFHALSSMDTRLTWPQILVQRGISSSFPHKFLWLTRQFKNADFVVSFNMITGMTALSYLASRQSKKPLVIFPFYHVGLSTFEKPSLFKMLRDATLLICSTDFEKQSLIRQGMDPQKVKVVNEGACVPSIERAALNNVREALDKREDQLLLMYVGRRDYDKGYPHVLSAVSHLVKSGFAAKLVVCGQGTTGSDRADYVFLKNRNAILDLGVANEQTKIAAMSLSDAIVLPSRAETYPLAFVESWLLGKPVIGAKIGSVSSIVREGVDGLLVEFGDVLGLAGAIKLLYSSERRIEMGRSAQIRAQNELTLEKSLGKIRKIFHELSGTSVTY